MASRQKVKQYLACWFQLGKKLICENGQEVFCPDPVLRDNGYSPQFEACWEKVLSQEGKNCYLEGIEPTIEVLLSPAWDIDSCARCQMPIPRLELGLQPPGCPCVDIPLWPNYDLPLPRLPVNTTSHLEKINARLKSAKSY